MASDRARTALLYVLPAWLLVVAWLGLESGDRRWSIGAGMACLALLPALPRPAWARAAASALCVPVALAWAFDLPLSRDFPGAAVADLKDGALLFYDVSLPFAADDEPLMHGAALVGVFAFCLIVALALAARRPLLASLGLVTGAAWPATLVSDANRLGLGALILAAVLAMLAWGGRRPARSVRPVVIAGAALVLAAVAAGTQPGVAKGEFLGWKGWDPYDKPADPVGVDYVWDASYDGIKFPDTPTDVLRITGPERALYWRAATLDEFRRDRWVEAPAVIGASDRPARLLGDPMLPAQARDVTRWVEAKVEVSALRDDHLVGASMPVALDPNGIGTVEYRLGNVAVVDGGLERGDSYTVWSYAPRPSPRALASVRPTSDRRNSLESSYLQVVPGAEVPPFGVAGRDARVRTLAANRTLGARVRRYLPLYERALEVAGAADNEYAAVVAIESWFRSRGGFTYEESPPRLRSGAAPLVDFVERTKSGYCQHYAGAMALMLRYLGIPARVAVGFTSGKFEPEKRRWTVSDHDAHAWVEVWFNGWGWLPFDPTPTRGVQGSPYSTASASAAVQSAIDQILRQSLRRGGEAVGGPAEGTDVEAAGRDVPGDFGGTVGAAARTGGSLLKLLALLALALFGVVAAAKLGRRRIRYLTRDPRRVAAACRAELVEFLLDQGVRVPRSATAHELAALLSGELHVDARAFADAVAAARYAPRDRAGEAARRARRELLALERVLRKRLTNAERARGFLSVRSLGFGGAAA
ncbi:MAG TPA: transglutaminaseTgpA domain-containing protein [Gaiellaceae bacterium]|nr:transglutaminaseTgpA domain-containing protein [Gaiellaceae bacterium]